MAIARRSIGAGTYSDFKQFVKLFGNQRYIFWANSPGNYMYIMNLDPVGDVAIFASGIVLDNPTIISDFPDAIQISSSSINSKLYSNVSIGSGHAEAGFVQFNSYDYNEFKTLVSSLNFGGPILYSGDFQCSAYSADCSLKILYQAGSQPSSFTTDFPNAISVTGLP